MPLDFNSEFSRFVTTGNTDSVSSIYKMQPSFTPKQIKILLTLRYYADKYDLAAMREYIRNIEEYMVRNKDLGFFKSSNIKSMLRAVTMEEYMKGMSYRGSSDNDKK